MPSRDVPIRLSLQDAETVKRGLAQLGDEGQRALKRIEAAAAPASKGLVALDATSRGLRSEMAAMAGRLGPVGAGLAALGPAGLAAAAAIGVLTLGFGAAIREAAEAEKVSLRLDAVLRATGGTAGLTAKQIGDMASGLQAATGTSDEAIKEMAATLATFHSVSGAAFKDTIRLSLDMAAVFGGDARSAVTTLGKALDDPIQGLTALRRVGIVLNETQRETIRVMVEAGDKAGAQGLILDALKGKIGGAAEAEAGGLTGSVNKLGATWSDFLEEVGKTDGFMKGAIDAVRRGVEAITAEFGTSTRLRRIDELITRLDSPVERILNAPADISTAIMEIGGGAYGKTTNEAIAALRRERVEILQNLDIQRKREDAAQVATQAMAAAAEKQTAADEAARQAAEAATKAEKERLKLAEHFVEVAGKAVERQEEARAALAGQIEALREETRQLGMSDRARAIRNAELKAEREIKKGIVADGEVYLDQVRAEAGVLYDATAAHEAWEKAAADRRALAEREAEMMQEPFKNALAGVQGAFSTFFENVYSGGVDSFANLAATARQMFIRLAAELTALMVFRPQIAAGGLPGIFGSIGIGGSGSAGGFGGIAAAINSFGASTGIFGSGVSGAGASAAAALGLPYGAAAPATGLFGATASLSAVLGAAGIGAFGGSILGPMLGLNGTGSTLGGGAGAGIGALIGSAIPGVGTVIGGILGGLLGGVGGGLFGGGKKKTPQAVTNLIAGEGGLLTLGGDVVRAGGNVAATQGAAGGVAEIVNGVLASLGGRLAPGAGGGYVLTSTGKNQGTVFIGGLGQYGAGGSELGGFGSIEEAGAAVALGILRQAAAGGQIAGLSPTAATVLKTSKAGDLAGLGADLEFAKLYDALTKVVPATSAAEAAIKALDEQFAAAKLRAVELGLSVAELDAGLARAKGTLARDFDKAIDDAILALTDPLAAELRAAERIHAQRLADARTFGADLIAVERLNALERQRIVEASAAAETAARQAAAANIKQFIEGLLLGPSSTLTPAQQLEIARGRFGEVVAGRDAAAFPGAASSLLGAARTNFASSAGYASIFDQVLAAAAALAPGSVPGFQHGGSFIVGGSGGPDSQVVAFRATPGEPVTVGRPGNDNGAVVAAIHRTGEFQTRAIVGALNAVEARLNRVERELFLDRTRAGLRGA